MVDSVPWDQGVRVLNAVSCSDDALVGLWSDSVDDSAVDEVADVLYLDWGVKPVASEDGGVESGQISSAWGGMDTGVAWNGVITVIHGGSLVDDPVSSDPVETNSPSISSTNGHTVVDILADKSDFDHRNNEGILS